jgi:D-xylose transport system ATP-binding protein
LRERGVACVYISHKLDEVFAVADRITVLRDGQAQGTLAATATHPDAIIRLMVGRPIENLYPRRQCTVGEVLLRVRALDVAPTRAAPLRLSGVQFEVRAGEVLGIGGLMGAGRSELLLHLVGLWGARRGGEVTLDGRPATFAGPRAALGAGLALVTEDRKRYGIVPGQGVAFNLTLSSLRKICRGATVDLGLEATAAQQLVKDLRIRTHDLDSAVANLSGGNQQKVVLGKALMTEPRVLLLDEPTRGIDVGAKLEVYELVNRLTSEGRAIVLVSSELGELIGMSDRIMMLHEGRVGGCFERDSATQEALVAAAMGRSLEAA